MDLSDEQKARIRDEELRRDAEERYREQVRRDLRSQQSSFGDETTGPFIGQQGEVAAGDRNRLIAIACVVLVLFAAAILLWKPKTAPQKANKSEDISGVSDATEHHRNVSEKAKAEEVSLRRLSTAEIAEKSLGSVVVVHKINESGNKVGHGSGYVYSDDGVVITNYHVIRGANGLIVQKTSGSEVRVDSVLGYDVEHDVAVIYARDLVGRPLPTLETESTKVGEKVVAIGAPLGLQSTVSEGIVSARRSLGGISYIQTTAPISHGSSGGPLLNELGQVVGITTSTVVEGQNLNLAIPARFITELAAKRRPIFFAEFLGETRVAVDMPSAPFSVQPRSGWKIPFDVPWKSGAVLTGSYTVVGGSNDIEVVVVAPDNRILYNSGRVSDHAKIRVELPAGSYFLYFNNQFSLLTPKLVSANVKLEFYR